MFEKTYFVIQNDRDLKYAYGYLVDQSLRFELPIQVIQLADHLEFTTVCL